MNRLLKRPEFQRLAKSQIVHLLDAICQAIEPTESQYNDAAAHYKTIGEFLAEEGSPLHCFDPVVYPQGSMRIRSAIRPVHGKEYDVDLVCEFKKLPHNDPKVVKKLVWDRFHGSDRYRTMAVEKNRCVQLNYTGDFHMDVMPCVPGQTGWPKAGPVWVPDKKLDSWKPSNPVGFGVCVETAAAKQPLQRGVFIANSAVQARAANVEPLPEEQRFSKPALIRIIQILKCHRDGFFRNNHDLAPISIIITTLATHSYERAVTQKTFDSVYDLMLEVLDGMPDFIQVNQQTAEFCIPNPSHPQENFAERWNNDPKLGSWFFTWHRKVTAEVKALAEQEAEGLDKVGEALETSFGAGPANRAIRSLSSSLRNSTSVGRTSVTSAGLLVPSTIGIQHVSKVPRHNFHGS
jgi:hypothetical protein